MKSNRNKHTRTSMCMFSYIAQKNIDEAERVSCATSAMPTRRRQGTQRSKKNDLWIADIARWRSRNKTKYCQSKKMEKSCRKTTTATTKNWNKNNGLRYKSNNKVDFISSKISMWWLRRRVNNRRMQWMRQDRYHNNNKRETIQIAVKNYNKNATQ